jgi:hypothetical protein
MRNLEDLAFAIRADKAISMRQAQRFSNCTEAQLLSLADRNKFVVREIEIPRTVDSSQIEDVSVICANAYVTGRTYWKIRHLLALAEFRWLVNAPPEKWVLRALENPKASDGSFISGAIPDAIWHSPTGSKTIEYDAGSHVLEVVAEKILAYTNPDTHCASQLWVVGTAERARNIFNVSRKFGVKKCSVVILPWWL